MAHQYYEIGRRETVIRDLIADYLITVNRYRSFSIPIYYFIPIVLHKFWTYTILNNQCRK